jgi:hypothetical protein
MNGPVTRMANKPESANTKDLQSDVRDINTTLSWHFRVGAMIAVGFIGVFSYFALHVWPADIDRATVQVKSDLQNQLSPMATDIAVLTARLDLREPDAASKLPGTVKKRTSGQGATLRQNFKIISALADEASSEKIHASPVMMSDAGRAVYTVAMSKKDTAPESWQAVSALINYQAYLFSDLYGLTDVLSLTKPCIENPPSLVSGPQPEKVPGVNQHLYKMNPRSTPIAYKC